MKTYHVYILANRPHGALYVGVTSALKQRLYEHRTGFFSDAFSHRYRIVQLVYYETGTDVRAAIAREKQIKGWRRARKVALIESFNPGWIDLAPGFLVI